MVYSNHSSDVLSNCEHFWCKRLPQHVIEVSFHWSDNIASRRGERRNSGGRASFSWFSLCAAACFFTEFSVKRCMFKWVERCRKAKCGSCRSWWLQSQLGGLGTISGACDFESLVLEPQNRRGPVCRARHTFQDVSGRGTLGFWRCTVTGKLQMSFEPVRQICQ